MNIKNSKSGKYFIISALYFSEGAPIGFIWWALPTLLRKSNVPIETITGLVALLVLPWIFKFLWAPLVDVMRTQQFGYKRWILLSQITMGVALIPLLFFDPFENFSIWGILLFIHSLAASTQDVAIDAYVINTVLKNDRGILNGYMQAGMLLGRSLFGGGTLIIASTYGLSTVIVLLILVIWSITFLLFFIKETSPELISQNRFKVFFKNFRIGFINRRSLLVILFALMAGAAFESAGALAGPFLIDNNVDEKSIGYFFSIPVVAAMLFGGIVGGKLSDIFNRKKTVSVFIIGFVLFVLAIGIIDIFIPNPASTLFFFLFTGMYFFVGLFVASSYGFFMDMTNSKIAGTQFSTFMAATNGCEAWSVWIVGLIIPAANYSIAFFIMGAVSLIAILPMFLINKNNAE